MVPPLFLRKLSLWLAIASAVSILLSIAISQILLALAVSALMLSGLPLRWPRIAIPIGLFLIWSVIALVFSPDPAWGLAQERKVFVYLTMLTLFSAIQSISQAKWLAWLWMAVGSFTAGRGILQFVRDEINARAAHRDFYHYYVADRITGFMGHWMTFSGQELFVFFLLIAFLFFGRFERKWFWLWIPCATVTGLALAFSGTRSVWAAAVLGGVYLLWMWRKWAVIAVPAVAVLVLAFGPEAIRIRANSIVHPETQTDSNEHRYVCRRLGWEMIKAHPLLGVGPDEIEKESVRMAYLPKDIHLPLPQGYYGHLHNFYIQYAAERGIPATLFIVAGLLLALWDFRNALLRLPPGRSAQRFFLHAAIACIAGAMAAGYYEYNLNDTEVLTVFLGVMCLGYLAAGQSAPAVSSAA
ncbi:MAG: O-antigen ligase family protein [Acidobacteriota bacterium]|nr:O-antigen ligase family protein [Acidobacteriota bacterium]